MNLIARFKNFSFVGRRLHYLELSLPEAGDSGLREDEDLLKEALQHEGDGVLHEDYEQVADIDVLDPSLYLQLGAVQGQHGQDGYGDEPGDAMKDE